MQAAIESTRFPPSSMLMNVAYSPFILQTRMRLFISKFETYSLTVKFANHLEQKNGGERRGGLAGEMARRKLAPTLTVL
jgi:hypothetical protein